MSPSKRLLPGAFALGMLFWALVSSTAYVNLQTLLPAPLSAPLPTITEGRVLRTSSAATLDENEGKQDTVNLLFEKVALMEDIQKLKEEKAQLAMEKVEELPMQSPEKTDETQIDSPKTIKSANSVKRKKKKKNQDSKILPDKVFTIVGLESSGTTFVTSLIQKALELPIQLNPYHGETIGAGLTSKFLNNPQQDEYNTEVQHVSLPWGACCTRFPRTSQNPLLPVIYPSLCSRLARERVKVSRTMDRNERLAPQDIPTELLLERSEIVQQYFQQAKINDTDTDLKDQMIQECYQLMAPAGQEQHQEEQRNSPEDDDPEYIWHYEYPRRHILNITANLEWYEERGVDAKAIIVMRDKSVAARARHQHCHNSTLLDMEEERGLQSIREAIDRYMTTPAVSSGDSTHGNIGIDDSFLTVSPNRKVIVVSYEMMYHLQDRYLKAIFAALGIESTYWPEVHDGNAKHVLPRKSKEQPQTQDDGAKDTK